MPRLLRLLVVVLLAIPAALRAQQGPVTTADPAISLADLQSLVDPLTKAELEGEAAAWRELIKAKASEIAQVEIQSRSAQDEATRQQLAERQATLFEEQTALVDRLRVVLDEWADKGGAKDAIEEYELYAGAVAGLKVDVFDTGAAWTAIVNWATSPEGGLRVGKNILFFLLTLIAFRILSKILGRIVDRSLSTFRKTPQLLRDFFVNTVRKLTFFIGIVVALSMLEIDIGPFLAAIGAAGFVIGFALQGTLSNFASGIMILLYRPYDIGDVVTIAGVTGTVEAMTLVSTAVRTGDNQLIVIPNSTIWGGIITNITGKDTRRVDLVFGIGYGDDIGKAERVLQEIVQQHPLVLKEPEPVIKVDALADSSVNLIVRPWAKTGDYWAVKWDITRKVKERFDEEGISIPFPQRDVHLYQASPSS